MDLFPDGIALATGLVGLPSFVAYKFYEAHAAAAERAERKEAADRAERMHARELHAQVLTAPYQSPYPTGLHTLNLHGVLPERTPAPVLAPPSITEAPPALPGVTTLGQVLDTGWRPSQQAILLGQGPGGVPLTAAVGDELCHMILAGRTGAGKTNIMRLLLVQVLAAGCQVYLCNPKYTVHHWKTGERWDTLARATAPGRAVTDLAAICALIRHLATVEFAARKARFEAGQQPGTPIVLFLDELPAIIGHDPALMDPQAGALSLLLRQGREFLIEIVICSQDVLVETMGGNGGLRGQFQTRYYGGGDETSKRILLQPRPKEVLPEPPGRGVLYLWAVPTGRQAQMVRVPLVTNEDIERVLGSAPLATTPATEPLRPATAPATDWFARPPVVVGDVVDTVAEPGTGVVVVDGKPVDAETLDKVRDGIAAGKSAGETAQGITGSKGGDRYGYLCRVYTACIVAMRDELNFYRTLAS